MLPGAIALVAYETVFGKFLVQHDHVTVPCHLRNHTRRRDGKRESVTFYQSLMGNGVSLDRQTVDQGDVRFFRKTFYRKTHRAVGGAEDVDLIDHPGVHERHRPDNSGHFRDLLIEGFADFF